MKQRIAQLMRLYGCGRGSFGGLERQKTAVFQEERRLEILRREEESRREKVTSVSFTDDGEDDPCYRRIKRGVKFDPSDPCYRRLKG